MQAYHNDQSVKDKYVNRMQAHMDADELVRGGEGWTGSKGCAVGCTLNKYEHKAFEDELGIPEWAARLLDTLHENTSDDVWPTLSIRFLKAIKPGADLSKVKNQINIFILGRSIERVEKLDIDSEIKTKVLDAIKQCKALHLGELSGVIIESAVWSAAESAARSAAESAARSAAESAESVVWSAAESAARSAARSAAESAVWSAESAVWSAVWSVVWSAESAVWSAESAAESAVWSVVWSAESAESAVWSAESAARSAELDAIASRFIELLEAA